MAIFSALLSLLSRKLGQLVQAIFGWAVTGLFGRLPSTKQIAVSASLLLAIAWPLLVAGAIHPPIAAWGIAFVPLHDWVAPWVLRVVWLSLALVVPPIVGAIARWVSPSDARKGGVMRGVLAGYPLTLGFAVAFLITLFVVPVLKLIALSKGHSDEHVYCQVKKGKYAVVLEQIRDALRAHGMETHVEPAPRAMGLATRVIKWFARGGLDPIVADDPKVLRGERFDVYLYPGDILLRGKKLHVAQARAALIRELVDVEAWLTEDPKAQHIEDELRRMWAVVARHGEQPLGATAAMRVREIARELERTPLPFEQWTLLYTNLERLDRAVSRVAGALEQVNRSHEPQGEVVVMEIDPRPEASTADLVREALDETKRLVKLEVELAKDEVRRELEDAKRAAIFFGIAAVTALLAAAMLFVALALAIFPGPVPALVIGAVLIAAASICAFVAWKRAPKKPLDRTKKRLETDAQVIKEGVA